ncbi:unnamed protein product [Linum tenue]|uniref:Uncharacterized protein n=1 Tax=Linum tenue TaxID=586396 RepID=A0AAV0QNG5_9ROSI|nr:unnamed protein product [Linum tenue]
MSAQISRRVYQRLVQKRKDLLHLQGGGRRLISGYRILDRRDPLDFYRPVFCITIRVQFFHAVQYLFSSYKQVQLHSDKHYRSCNG